MRKLTRFQQLHDHVGDTERRVRTARDGQGRVCVKESLPSCLPAAGVGFGSYLYYPGSGGDFWSSSPDSDNSSSAWYLYFDSDYFCRYNFIYRFNGFPVRPLRGFTK